MTQLKPCPNSTQSAAAGRLAKAPTRWKLGLFVVVMVGALHLFARGKDATQYGMGLIVNLPYPESEVTQVVQEIIQNGMIRGSKEYNKDEFISGATAVSSTKVFPEWTEGGKVFYKVRFKALDPRNFKDSGDVGTLAVRYVVQAQDDKHTVLRIDARYVEDFRHTAHASNGSVESAEYKDIHDHLDSLELVKTETAEALKRKQESTTGTPDAAVTNVPLKDEASTPRVAPAPPVQAIVPAEVPPAEETKPSGPPKTLQEQVHDLRQQVQRLVKAPGAPLKSAPFHSAATLQSLPAGTEVLIVISTTYWLGVETHDGQHGWILRDDLELMP